MMHIDFEKCTGCGACLEICPVEAIWLEAGKATIDLETCIDCSACVQTCPVEAIYQSELPVPVEPVPVHPVVVPQALPVESAPSPRLAPWAETAVAFIGREIVPRVADILITALERQLSQPADLPSKPPQATAPEVRTRTGSPRRRRRRAGRRFS